MAVIGAAAACMSSFAMANSITYGFDSSTGLLTVTQTATNPSGLGAFSFLSFAQLVANDPTNLGSAVYANGDSTFDFEYTTDVSAFTIQNLKGSSDTVNAQVQELFTPDGGTTMPGATGTGDQKRTYAGVGFGYTGNTINSPLVYTASTMTGITLAANGNPGDTYTQPGLPATATFGIGYNNCSTFGDVSAGDASNLGCSILLSSTSYATSGFSFGIDGQQQTASSETGGGNSQILSIAATSSFTSEAEVTYEYYIPSGTPEPTTMFLMGGALIGLGMLGKRLKKN